MKIDPINARAHVLNSVVPVPEFLPESRVVFCSEFRGVLHTEFRKIPRNSAKVKSNSEKIPTPADLQNSTSLDTLILAGIQFFSREHVCIFVLLVA